ncbi:MAG: glutathione S-transferase family protein [Rhodospirillales bacterium]|nr:MAG: glutathione S-transferase family protein [Rhodospirillales bacterium]
MPPKLYAHPFSSYCQKVLIAFHEKGAAFDLQLLSSENPAAGAALKALWPLERFPVLDAGGRTLLESSVIVEWLDLHAGGPRLIPVDPDAALDVRMRDRVFDNYVMTPMQAIVFDRVRPAADRDPFGVAQARAMLDKSYAWLDGEMASREWAAGDTFTLADCAAAPALFYADWVYPIEGHRHLAAYISRLRARPSVARAVDDARPYRHLFPGGAPVDRE